MDAIFYDLAPLPADWLLPPVSALAAPIDSPFTYRTSSMRTKLLFAFASCAVALASSGCARPWTAPLAPSAAAAATEVTPNAGVTGTAPAVSHGVDHSAAIATGLPNNPSVSEPDLAGVLDKLQQVRAIDPAAEGKLVEELRRAPANSWPLVAEQFRASLAYREQLAASSGQKNRDHKQMPSEQFAALEVGTAGASPFQYGPDAKAENSFAEARTFPLQAGVQAEFTTGGSVLPNGIPSVAATSVALETAESADGTSIGATPDVVQATLHASSQALAEAPVSAPAESEPWTPPAAAANENWQRLVAKAADDLSRGAASSPTTTAEVHQHVSLRLLRLLAGDTQAALEPIPRISPAEQDYWSRQIFALATYLDHHGQPDDKRRAAASVSHLDEAVSHLRELGSLSVRNLSFCKNVYGYGAIEPYDADLFSPGQQVSLYVEVENYHSKSTEEGFCTLLGSTYELLNEAGERVGGGEIPDVNDCCRSRRRDFHIQYSLTMPEKLLPGRYQLQLVIKDRQSDKRGHATAAFEIKGAGP